MIDVDALAQEIRRVDGNHDKGAGALAEALMPFLALSLAPQVKEIDGGRFEEWSLSDFAAQCRMQSREQLDPEFSQFMAALAKRLASPPKLKVKPLDFQDIGNGLWSSGFVIGGEYRIMLAAVKGYQLSSGMVCVPDNQTWFPTLEAAKSAAQADYTARIMSAIEPAGVGVETLERRLEKSLNAAAIMIQALEKISSPSQSTGLLWWQIEARNALAAALTKEGEQ